MFDDNEPDTIHLVNPATGLNGWMNAHIELFTCILLLFIFVL